ncbi:MAG: putative colanic acid biosynthesis acetyltransferase WcaF [Phycisphaerales bacterium]
MIPETSQSTGPANPANPANPTNPTESVRLMRGDTSRHRLVEAAWQYFGQPVFRLSFHNWYGLRRRLLNAFGAQIHPAARIRPTVRISHPWQLSVGAHTAIGDNAILFCLGPISIGSRCTISQYVHLCSGSHDYTKREMPLINDPITIEDDVWLAADVFVGPGVTVGVDTVVGSRSTVMHSLPPRSICAGDNAVRLAKRVVHPIRAGSP